MPAVNPRRECPCSSYSLLTGRVDEEAVGKGPFVWLAVFGAVLGVSHFLLAGWGWIAWAVLLALDLLWLVILWAVTDEVRAQERHGLGYVRLDAASQRLGGGFRLHVGSGRRLAGLRGLEARLQCVDAFMEEREVAGQEGPTKEMMQICYVVWEDSRAIDAAQLPAEGEASFEFTLPLAGDFAGPWGTWVERYWNLEVVRRGGASPLRFRLLVYP